MSRYLHGLALSALLVSTPLFATQPSAQELDLKICHGSREIVHQLWQGRHYDAPPVVSAMMVAAMNGKTATVEADLSRIHGAEAKRWRQLALSEAVLAGQTATVKTLLDHGADATAGGLLPTMHAALYRHLVKQAIQGFAQHVHAPHTEAKSLAHALKKSGILVANKTRPLPAPLYAVVTCNDVATVRVLLRHGAHPMRQARPENPPPRRGPDPFLDAVMAGDSTITGLFLDHGADPCVEDKRMAANWKREQRKPPVPTIASIGNKSNLPASLIRRLACHAPPSASAG